MTQKKLFGEGKKCDPFLSLKIYLLQHLHLVAKEGRLVAEEFGLVGEQVTDGRDRGGELGGRI